MVRLYLADIRCSKNRLRAISPRKAVRVLLFPLLLRHLVACCALHRASSVIWVRSSHHHVCGGSALSLIHPLISQFRLRLAKVAESLSLRRLLLIVLGKDRSCELLIRHIDARVLK